MYCVRACPLMYVDCLINVQLLINRRPYYHIWTSCNPQQSLLLLPSLGVTWYGGHKRPPLFDPDPQQQSVHYRKWTKPLSKEVRVQLDSIIRATNRSTRRSFLLSGPPQVWYGWRYT